VDTQYAFILNPDAVLEENSLEKFYKAQIFLKDDFTILAPNLFNNYGYFLNSNKNINKEILEVDYVKGFAMLINLKKIHPKDLFDENFFLFLEEIDLCKRIKQSGGKIFVIQNSKIHHLGKQASENILNIELCRNWHWMWSLFYYNYKHFGIITAYRVAIIRFFSSIFKLFFSFVFFNKKKILIHYYRINGLFNAFLRRPSWLRPDNI
jgi:GT2 family glycosyltransferase